jgi:predicted RNase H-like nuclease (RuvC/YqgF family)
LQPLKHFFEVILTSADAKVQKPDRTFYEKLINQLFEKQENILFIDDKLENIEGAKLAGLQTLHYQRGQELAERINEYCRERACPFPNSDAEGIHHQIQTYQSQITAIKTFLTDINYKSREDKSTQKEQLQKQLHTLDQTIMQLETETQKLQTYQQQKTAFQTSLNNLEQQIEELQVKS